MLRVLETHCCRIDMDRSRRPPLLELLMEVVREVEEALIVQALVKRTEVAVAEVQTE